MFLTSSILAEISTAKAYYNSKLLVRVTELDEYQNAREGSSQLLKEQHI